MTHPVEQHSLIGARIVVESERVARPRRAGIIAQVVDSPMASYRVLWDDGRTSIVTPASGCAQIETVRDVVETPFAFRAINEAIRRLESPWVGVHDFVCECPDPGCTQVMRLSVREYDDVRAVRYRFAVAPGHEQPATERVVTRCERYLVVERLKGDIA